MHFHPRETMNHLGIDVHKDESHVAVLDDNGEVDREIRVENANLDEVAEEYEGSQAAIEATGNYYTIYDTLDEYLDVVVADPQQTKALELKVQSSNIILDTFVTFLSRRKLIFATGVGKSGSTPRR